MKLGTIAGMPVEVEDEAIEKVIKIAVRELVTATLELYDSDEFVERISNLSTKITEKIVNDMLELEDDKTSDIIS